MATKPPEPASTGKHWVPGGKSCGHLLAQSLLPHAVLKSTSAMRGALRAARSSAPRTDAITRARRESSTWAMVARDHHSRGWSALARPHYASDATPLGRPFTPQASNSRSHREAICVRVGERTARQLCRLKTLIKPGASHASRTSGDRQDTGCPSPGCRNKLGAVCRCSRRERARSSTCSTCPVAPRSGIERRRST